MLHLGYRFWFCCCLQHITVFCTTTVGGKWRLPPEKAAGNEDSAECVRVPFTPHAKPSEPQAATKCVFNLLNQMARWQWHYLIIFVCVCACSGKCLCSWDLMDFSQDSDKPIYLRCKMLSLQILIQIPQQIDDHTLSARHKVKLTLR